VRAFVITGPGEAAVQDVAPPVAAPGEVVVQVARAGVCGTDVEFFTGDMQYLHDGFAEYPMRIGHEWMGTVASIGVGLVAALALRGAFRGRVFVRASMLLPYVAPVVAVTFVWQTMLSPQFGIVNAVGQDVFGWADPVAFLSQRSATVSILGLPVAVPVALLTVMAFETWRYFPFAFLFLTARIQALPGDLEEAARIDGATPSQRFRYVVFPQLLPTIALLTVLRFIMTFNKFDDVYLLTGGGAGTEVVSVRVYDLLTARGDIGAASAQALVLALILVLLLGLYFRFVGRPEEA